MANNIIALIFIALVLWAITDIIKTLIRFRSREVLSYFELEETDKLFRLNDKLRKLDEFEVACLDCQVVSKYKVGVKHCERCGSKLYRSESK